MMDFREWAALFGNPRFMPRPEVMRTQAGAMAQAHRNIRPEVSRAEMDELRLSVAAIGNVVSELYARAEPAAPVSVQPAGESADTMREGLLVAINKDEDAVEERQESGLIPVDSVVYSVEDGTKPKKGFFGRKKT